MKNKKVIIEDWERIGYQKAWDRQEALLHKNVQLKHDDKQDETQNRLIFCEHPPVFTLGKSGHMANLLASQDRLKEKGIEFVKTNRGGDITFHGPEQIVGYPILDLENFFTDIAKYLRSLEEVIIRTIAEYGINGERSKGKTGVWIDAKDPAKARKICAMGVRCSRWVTMHGFALNVNTDLSYFDLIVPCGIKDKKVASIKEEVGQDIDMAEVKQKLVRHFEEVFEASRQ
ncbi:MAG TPA: lipoyl(octanoyl) transferase LipB [Chitinophagaceae bacterium]|nr:lipoyl(octanoyl) transferase LipB [Chitinophagaceae bacterium]